jgi:GH35 family endo-1,4-beta-xylanase
LNPLLATRFVLLIVVTIACASEATNANAPTLTEPPKLENPVSEAQVLNGADQRIEFYRKGYVRVLVRDVGGKPVQGANVRLEQTRHAFLFGSNIFLLNLSDTSNLQEAYRKRFVALLNYATLPFYWGAYEPTRGKPDQVGLEGMARWARDQGIVTKGHPLVWHTVYPEWAPKDAASTIPLLQARVTSIVQYFRGLIDIWDVVNEANAAVNDQNGVGDWARRDTPAGMVGTVLGWARQANPNATVLYNDFDTSKTNLEMIATLERQNRLPDVIGIQSHMHGGVWTIPEVWQRTSDFSRFNRPIHFTETTVLSAASFKSFNPSFLVFTDFTTLHFSVLASLARSKDLSDTALSGSLPFDWARDYDNPPKPWPTTSEGEAAQAAYVTKFYTTLFSHPNARAITWWDFSDKDSWLGAPAGLLRADMSPKPAYDRLMALIRGAWWTRANGTTDANGAYLTRAFLGLHRATVTANGQTRTVNVEVSKNGNGETVLELRL